MSDQTNDRFAERLLEADAITPAYRQQYEKEIQAMLNRKLTPLRRAAWMASGILGLGFMCVFTWAAAVVPLESGFPVLARIGFILGAVFGLAWFWLAFTIVRKGTINLKRHPTIGAGMVWGMVVIMVTLFMLQAGRMDDAVRGVMMVVNGLVFLVMAAVFMIANRVDQAELKTREKLLEIEHRLAELSDTLAERR